MFGKCIRLQQVELEFARRSPDEPRRSRRQRLHWGIRTSPSTVRARNESVTIPIRSGRVWSSAVM